MPTPLNLLGSSNISSNPCVLPFREFSSKDLLALTRGTSSKGNQKKYKTCDGQFYIKELFQYDGREWRDDLVEVSASRYAGMCTLPSGLKVVSQGLCCVDGRPASYSESFDRDGSVFVSYLRAVRRSFGEDHREPTGSPAMRMYNVIGNCSSVLGCDAAQYIVAMSLLDLIFVNEDRHLHNFGFLREVDGSIQFAPLFDFGLGMFECGAGYDTCKSHGKLPDVTLKPFDFRASKLLNFLVGNFGDLVSAMLPTTVELSQFTFPSALAEEYFCQMNERLGVHVV